MVTTPIINEPFTKIAMDIAGPLNRTKSGKKYILTIIDHSTRYPEAFVLKEIDAKSVANALIELFSRVGLPKIILTDQGSNFKSKLLKELYEMVNIQSITTSPYTPQSNGCVERFNGTLKSVLKKLCTENTNEWDELLPFVLFACIQVPHEETGFAPFELLYGWPVRGPTQLFEGLMTGEDETQKSVIETCRENTLLSC